MAKLKASTIWTTVLPGIAVVFVTGWFIALVKYLFNGTNASSPAMSEGFPATETLFVAALLVVMVSGVVLVRYSRPYSANPPGLLIAWLGIGLILFSLTVLVALCKALVLAVS